VGAHNAINSSENPFWQYSIVQYSKPGCADFLLDAQNRDQLNINQLLFFGYCALHNRVVSSPLHPQIHNWHEEKVERIRAIRLRCKHFNNQKFYAALKELELASEQHEQSLLLQLQMTRKSQESFELCLRKSVEGLLIDERKKLNEDWLQTLNQYLQPMAGD